MDRRSAIKNMILLAAAPAIVKLETIMPVKPIVKDKTLYPCLMPLQAIPVSGKMPLSGNEEFCYRQPHVLWLTREEIRNTYPEARIIEERTFYALQKFR